MAVVLAQSVVSIEGRELIASVVQDEKSGERLVHARELASSRDHSLVVEEAELSGAEIIERLGMNAAGKLVVVEPAQPGCLHGKTTEEVLSDASSRRELLVRCVTWNLQARPTASAAELRRRLLPLEDCHLVHVGTQECERSIAASVINQSKAKWMATVQQAVGPKYTPLVSHTLQATHSVLFVHEAILPLLSGVRSAAVATGLGAGDTRLGNKGAVGLALEAGDTKLLFVTAHLAAHQKNDASRNRQVRKISTDLARLLCESPVSRVAKTLRDPASDEPALLDAFDCVFWSGDLNYRVDMSRPDADAALAAGDLARLHDADQLKTAIAAGAAFVGFSEGPLTFNPTYKFDTVGDDDEGSRRSSGNVDVYDTSAKQRVPSWTDRVLWGSRDEERVRLVEYQSVSDLRSSDHRPVFASFVVGLASSQLRDSTDTVPTSLHQSQVCVLQ